MVWADTDSMSLMILCIGGGPSKITELISGFAFFFGSWFFFISTSCFCDLLFFVSCSWSADLSTNRLCRRFSTLTDGSWRCCISLLPSFYWCIKFENWKEKFPWWILREPSAIHGCSDWMRLSMGAKICSRVLRVISSVIEKIGWKFDVRSFGLTIWLEHVVDHAPQNSHLASAFSERFLDPSITIGTSTRYRSSP